MHRSCHVWLSYDSNRSLPITENFLKRAVIYVYWSIHLFCSAFVLCSHCVTKDVIWYNINSDLIFIFNDNKEFSYTK